MYHTVNLEATSELARLSIESGIKRFVFVSSVKAGVLLISEHFASEEEQNDPEGFYGKTKRQAELKQLKTGKELGMNVSIIRP